MIGDVGASQFVGVGGEHASHIDGDVAVTDDDDPLVAEIDWQIGEVGVTVDPGHDLGSGAGTGQVHAVDVQPAVIGRADGVDDGVVVRQQVIVAEVLADLDVEEEPEFAATGDPVEERSDPLGGLVVRRHPGAHQPVWGGQLLEDIDPHTGLGEQFVGGIHRSRTGSHDRHGQRAPVISVIPAHLWCGDHRRQFGCRRQLLACRAIWIVRRVERDEGLLFWR